MLKNPLDISIQACHTAVVWLQSPGYSCLATAASLPSPGYHRETTVARLRRLATIVRLVTWQPSHGSCRKTAVPWLPSPANSCKTTVAWQLSPGYRRKIGGRLPLPGSRRKT